MLNVLIAGVGGQGSVLAAKILAQAATEKGWHVRTAETIGMAQRGGSVLSHVRMGNGGERVHAPLVSRGQADCIIALEPGEGLRALPYLAPAGLMVCAQTGIASVVADLQGGYDPDAILTALGATGTGGLLLPSQRFVAVDDAAICAAAGSRKTLNVGMLAAAACSSNELGCGLRDAVTVEDLRGALEACVKPQFLEMNLKAMLQAADAPSAVR